MADTDLISLSEALDLVTELMPENPQARSSARFEILYQLKSGALPAVAGSLTVRREFRKWVRAETHGYDVQVPAGFWHSKFFNSDSGKFVEGDAAALTHSFVDWDWCRNRFARRVELDQPSGDLSSHEFAQALAVKVRKEILLCALSSDFVQPEPKLVDAKPLRSRGRRPGSGKIDDSGRLREMRRMIEAGEAEGSWQAETILSRNHRSNSLESSVRQRLHNTYWRGMATPRDQLI